MNQSWAEMSIIDKILYIYEIPLNILRDITIPPSENEKWNKHKVMLVCIFGPIFFCFATGSNFFFSIIFKHKIKSFRCRYRCRFQSDLFNNSAFNNIIVFDLENKPYSYSTELSMGNSS
jgi:hypothetical protein